MKVTPFNRVVVLSSRFSQVLNIWRSQGYFTDKILTVKMWKYFELDRYLKLNRVLFIIESGSIFLSQQIDAVISGRADSIPVSRKI